MEKIVNWVLLRGLLRESRHWGDFPDYFANSLKLKRENVFTLNLPGFGPEDSTDSPLTIREIAEDLRSQWILLKEKHEGPWGCLAMSLGAMATLEWAKLYPDDLQALVVINSSARDLSGPFKRFSILQLPRAFRISATSEAATREAEIYKLTSSGTATEEKAREWAGFAPRREKFFKAGFRQLLAAGLFRSPERLETPLLVLTSKGDSFVDFRCSEALARKYKATLRVHLTAGHDICLDDPKWVISQLKAWPAAKPS
jgi:pimeloyl-[acyl-carrier protein] methyl ester esterase